MNIATDVLAVLDQSACDGPVLRLPPALVRPVYVKVDKVLRAAGGRWDRHVGGHVFACDAAEVVDQLVLSGSVTTAAEQGWFPTPPAIVDRLLDLAEVTRDMWALEPSAGEGAIAAALLGQGCKVGCVELDPERSAYLTGLGFAWVATGDFLEMNPVPGYHRVVMNPPFVRGTDLAHVTRALRWLRPGGRLVAVMSAGVTFRSGAPYVRLREMVAAGGSIEELAPRSFPGTDVNAVIVTVNQP